MNPKTKALYLGVIVTPLLVLMIFRFIPDIPADISDRLNVSDALRNGGAYASCDKPFDDYLVTPRKYMQAECVWVGAERLYKVSTRRTLSKTSSILIDRGLNWNFDKIFSKRFAGKTVKLSIVAHCQGCVNEASVMIDAGYKAPREIFPLPLTGQAQRFDFNYTFPRRNPDTIKKGPSLIINPGQTGADINVYVKALYISDVLEVGPRDEKTDAITDAAS